MFQSETFLHLHQWPLIHEGFTSSVRANRGDAIGLGVRILMYTVCIYMYTSKEKKYLK